MNRKIDDMLEEFHSTGQWAFETFAKLHPHEAHELDKDKFYNFVRSEIRELSNDDIKAILLDT